MPLKVVARHKSPYLYLRGTVRGISVDESTGVGCKKQAEIIRAKREAELIEESIHGKVVTMTFAQAALSYMEHGGDSRYIERLLRHFGPTMKLSQIGQAEIDTAAKTLYSHCLPATVRRQCHTPISAVLNHAADRNWCNRIRIHRPKQPKGRVRWITHEEAERLIAACDDGLRPIVVFLLYTGARLGEALGLLWREVDLDRKQVQFLRTKTGVARGVPLHPRVITELRLIQNGEGLVFSNRKRGVNRASVSKIETEKEKLSLAGERFRWSFYPACERAGISNFRPHDCRHTWATWHYQANRDLFALQRLGGWQSIDMVARYAHTNVDELASTIDRL